MDPDGDEFYDADGEKIPEKGVSDITAADKYEFIQLTSQGYDRSEAALVLGYKARPWRSLTSQMSPFYDEEFTRAYYDAKGTPEANLNYIERVREMVNHRAMTDSDRLLEKIALVHLPEWQVLRQRDVNINVRAVFEAQLKELPTELLDKIIEALETGHVIDAEPADFDELPPAVESDDDPQEEAA